MSKWHKLTQPIHKDHTHASAHMYSPWGFNTNTHACTHTTRVWVTRVISKLYQTSICTYIFENEKKQQPKNKTSHGRDRQKDKKWGREETKAETPCYSYLCKLFEFGGWIPGRGDHDLGILHHGPSVLVILTGCQTCRRVSTQHARCAQSTHSTVCSVNS